MEANHIYQYSLLNALMAGVGGGGITASALLAKSCNQGLGTFARMDGELVLLDGRVYQLRAGGDVREAAPEDRIPFVVATNFAAQSTREGLALGSKGELDAALDGMHGGAANLFVTFRLEGNFGHLKCRTVRGQDHEGQSLAELGKKQSVEEYSDVEGTVVGIRSPENWQGFSVAGDHLHFISADRRRGGHVLELSTAGARLQVAVSSNVHVELPTGAAFNEAKLTTDDAGVRAVEG